jgi:dipeptidase
MVDRIDDGHFDTMKVIVVNKENQPRKYKSVIGMLEIDLPDSPLSYTSAQSVDTKMGIWPAM